MSPKIVNREKKRLEILSYSYYFFIKNGIKKSSMDALLKYLNMGKGTFYHYFSSKDELIKELILNLLNFYIQICDKKLKKATTLKEKLETLFELYLVDSKDNKEFSKLYNEYLIIYSNEKIFDDEYKIYHSFISSKLEDFFNIEIENKKINKEALNFINTLSPTADGMMLYSFLLKEFNMQKEFRNYLESFLELIKKD